MDLEKHVFLLSARRVIRPPYLIEIHWLIAEANSDIMATGKTLCRINNPVFFCWRYTPLPPDATKNYTLGL